MDVRFLNMSNFGLLFTVFGIACLVWEILAFVFKQKRPQRTEYRSGTLILYSWWRFFLFIERPAGK